jgi:hypothetical protein
MANAPPPGQDDGDKLMICVRREAECFSAQGWTGQITLKFLKKFPSARIANDASCGGKSGLVIDPTVCLEPIEG